MAEGSEKPQIVPADTNVIIAGAVELANGLDTPEARIWSAYLRGKLKLAFSEALLLETVRVARRLMSKDFASKLRSLIFARSKIMPDSELLPHVSQLLKEAPREDVVHAALASTVRARYVVSNNRKFLRSLETKSRFKCITPESFIEVFHI